MRVRIILAYDGGGTGGWQIQERPDPPFTFQGALEAALARLTGKRTRVYGAGRTDAGAHALGQNAHFDVDDKYADWDWRARLNALLPENIRALAAYAAPDDFHARKSALGKTYAYYFWLNSDYAPPRSRDFVWACGELAAEKMRACLPHFVGERDFASLQNAGTPVFSTVREIYETKLERLAEDAFFGEKDLLRLTVRGNGFLKQMVRNMAGVLWAAGKGKIGPKEVGDMLAAKDRRALKTATAPARGLFLVSVEYPPGIKFICLPRQKRSGK